MTDVTGILELLLRRKDILASVIDRPKERYEVVDDLTASKSTVYKGVSQLEEVEILEKRSDGLHPTLYGRVLYQRYAELEKTAAFRTLLSHIPEESEFDPVVLDGATMITPDTRSIDRHLTHAEQLVRDANEIQGFASLISSTYVSLFREKVVEDGTTVELGLERDLFDHVVTTYPNDSEVISKQENFTLWVTDESLPFGLVLLTDNTENTQVLVEVTNEEGLRGLIVNETRESIDWAIETYERYEQTATPIDR